MMTTLNKKDLKNENKISQENLLFHDSEEIVLTEQEIKDLEKKLEDKEISDETRAFFKSTHQFLKKLKENEYTISLEEIEK